MKKSLLAASIASVLLSIRGRVPPVEEQAGLRKVEPPEFLYMRVYDSQLHVARTKGLKAEGGRYWLWCNVTKLRMSSVRTGYTVLTVEAQDMHRAGHEFWLASDGSYTTRHIPSEFIQ